MTSLSVPGWPPGSASSGLQVPDIIFDVRIEILTLTNLYLDMHKGIPKCDFPICTWLASRISLQVVQNKKIFDIHEIYLVYNILTNFHEDPIIRSTQKSLLTPHFCLFFPFCGWLMWRWRKNILY